MKKENDCVGKRFGKLLVIQEIERPSEKNYGDHWLLCKCDCGKTTNIERGKLKYSNVTSCGCNNKRRGADSPFWTGYGEISGDYCAMLKRRAKGGGQANRCPKEFSLTIKYLWELFLKQNRKCAISGLDLSFDYQGDRLSWKKKETSKVTASLDRKDSSKGYIEGNVQWVHKHINIMKNDLDDGKFIEYCRIIAKNNP